MALAKKEYEVESLLLKRLQDMGYDYVEMHQYEDVEANFKTQLEKFNEDKLLEAKGASTLSDREFDKVLTHLKGKTVYESAKLLRDQFVLQLDNGKNVYLSFLSNDSNKNIFQVTHQVTVDPAKVNDVLQKNRYDVTLLINGLPLVQIELKRPGIELNEAVNQLNRYRRDSFKGLFKFIQIMIVSNGTITKYCANCNERNPEGNQQDILKSLVFYWTDINNVRITKLIEFAEEFLDHHSITEMLTKYFIIKESEPTLLVMRPYQIYAVQQAYDRVVTSAMNGYVFHTTGSGKTLTSFRLATLLRDSPAIKKVFFLIDRKDLDDQTVDEYNSFEKGCVDNTDNTKTLVADIQDSTKKLIITTIQKMASALRIERYQEVMDSLSSEPVVFIIDECHRSQFGKMHGQIEGHFKKGNYIGFTGTPIRKENAQGGKTTDDVFATGSQQIAPCIHTYTIKEAIADGNVLRFSVEFMRSMQPKNMPIDIDPAQLDDPEYCKEHGIDLDSLYHKQERIELIANDILDHLEQHTHPIGRDVYTAIFATDYVKYLMEYYRYMKAHNPHGYRIAAIFNPSFNPNADQDDSDGADANSSADLAEVIDDYNQMFGTDFTIDTFDGYRKDVSKRLKQKNLPQIDLLLVVNMFLTGFDSKATNTLILDKNLIYHSLLQAYSRTNRVDKPTKQFGQIVTYRNIKAAQDEALKLYSQDGNPAEFLMQSYEYYLTEYRKNVEALRRVARTPDDCAELVSEDDQRDFIKKFRTLYRTYATLLTFGKFDWADLDVFMDEKTLMDYKSWYLQFYDDVNKKVRHGIETPLEDIDFSIELVRTDKINVVYILQLLKQVNRHGTKEEIDKAVDLIMREIERSDNEKLRYKATMMKDFIRTRFYDLKPDEDIVEAYNQYESECMEKKIHEFAESEHVDDGLIHEVTAQYFTDERSISRESLRKLFEPEHLGLLKTTKLISDTMLFVSEMSDQFAGSEE